MSGHRWRAAWDYPMESGLVVVVPEAEGPVGPVRDVFDPYAKIGVPPHVTVLYPFIEPKDVTDELLHDIADVLIGIPPFSFELAQIRSFDDSIYYLAPIPSEPFISLTNALWGRFPDRPPFGGQFESIVPHMSVAGADLGATMESVSKLLEEALPITSTAQQVTLLLENEDGWSPGGVFPLAG